jgi:hypothetical protein
MKPFQLILCLLLPLGLGAQDLTFNVTNNRSQDIYLYFADAPITGTAPASLGGGALTTNIANTDSNYYLIAANSTVSGFKISDFSSGRVFVSEGQALLSGNGANFNNPANADYSKRFDHFEMTYVTSNRSSGANLTGTDFIGMPIQLSNATNTAKWTPPSFSDVLTQVTNTIQNQSTNNPGDAIVTGLNGVNVAGVGNVVRVIAPSTAVAGASSPYRDIGKYYDAMKNNTIGNKIHVMSDQFGNDYNLQGSVLSNGDVSLTQFNNEGDINSIVIDSSYFTAEELYGANPSEATIDGTLTASTSFSSNESAAIRDVFAGFNLGVWGSTEMIGGTALGDLTSQEFFALGTIDDFFSDAQLDPDFYNQYAEIIAALSDNSVYGFPYSDVLGGQFINTDPSGNPILNLTIQPDLIPEPANCGLMLSIGVFGLLLLRRRRV